MLLYAFTCSARKYKSIGIAQDTNMHLHQRTWHSDLGQWAARAPGMLAARLPALNIPVWTMLPYLLSVNHFSRESVTSSSFGV